VTRGQLPQRAGSPGLNGGGAAAAVPPQLVSLKNSKLVSSFFIIITVRTHVQRHPPQH